MCKVPDIQRFYKCIILLCLHYLPFKVSCGEHFEFICPRLETVLENIGRWCAYLFQFLNKYGLCTCMLCGIEFGIKLFKILQNVL